MPLIDPLVYDLEFAQPVTASESPAWPRFGLPAFSFGTIRQTRPGRDWIFFGPESPSSLEKQNFLDLYFGNWADSVIHEAGHVVFRDLYNYDSLLRDREDEVDQPDALSPEDEELLSTLVQKVKLARGRISPSVERNLRSIWAALIDAPYPSRAVTEAMSPSSEKLLERLEGFVEKIEGDVAYVTLQNDRGEKLCGPYPAQELAEKGLQERDRFTLQTVDLGDCVRIDITPLPRITITPERSREIREKIEQVLDGYTPEDDY